ncbi:unnamed protein product [Paramecium sonneborni]|uniref:Dol-P-Glc:Glc(2)Man(9)GlcNAc(2)-PP-Dol alpha-1,2-glucosyltransferase n=1 Tax=Paramecium sonneborni TaxID=65129 RepID=A0A8S1M6B6_9CILI|nr:unnamed protein product [Paramecium sonneborni]
MYETYYFISLMIFRDFRIIVKYNKYQISILILFFVTLYQNGGIVLGAQYNHNIFFLSTQITYFLPVLFISLLINSKTLFQYSYAYSKMQKSLIQYYAYKQFNTRVTYIHPFIFSDKYYFLFKI